MLAFICNEWAENKEKRGVVWRSAACHYLYEPRNVDFERDGWEEKIIFSASIMKNVLFFK